MLAARRHSKNRDGKLMEMLVRLRDETYVRVKEFRREQEQDAEPVPADEMDAARSLADVETHASLIEQAEQRLKLIDEAIARAEAGAYGRCADCGEDIPIERLAALPFAIYCIDCQQKRNQARKQAGEGAMLEPYGHRWTAAEELALEPEREYEVTVPKRGRPSSIKTTPQLRVFRPGKRRSRNTVTR